MAQISYPFDGGTGASITEQQWSNMASLWQDDGVVAGDPTSMSLKVTTLTEPGVVYVETGQAYIAGFYYELTTQLAVPVPENDNDNDRIDLVILKLDKSTNGIAVAYKEGTPASSPVPPALENNASVRELALAQIQMGPHSNSVPNTAPQLVDKRPYIGKRVRPSEDGAAVPAGNVFYKPSEDRFYVKRVAGYESVSTGNAGTTVCTSTTRPAFPTAGQQIYETDTDRVYVWSGSSWRGVNAAAAQTVYIKRFPGAQNATLGVETSFSQLRIENLSMGWYQLSGVIHHSAPINGATFGIRLSVSTNTGTGYYWSAQCRTSTSAGEAVTEPWGNTLSGIYHPLAGTVYTTRFEGVSRHLDANGSFIQVVIVNPTATLTVHASSFVRVDKIID